MDEKKKKIPIEEIKIDESKLKDAYIDIEGKHLELRFSHKAMLKFESYLEMPIQKFMIEYLNGIQQLSYKTILAIIWVSLRHVKKYDEITFDDFIDILEESEITFADVNVLAILAINSATRTTIKNENENEKKKKKQRDTK